MSEELGLLTEQEMHQLAGAADDTEGVDYAGAGEFAGAAAGGAAAAAAG